MTLGVTIVGAVMLASGVLILVGAVAMTKFQRIYEAAEHKTSLQKNRASLAR